jgi:hypothetical protein
MEKVLLLGLKLSSKPQFKSLLLLIKIELIPVKEIKLSKFNLAMEKSNLIILETLL